MHDTVNSLTYEDEIRQIGALISTFVTAVQYDDDPEKLLNFYVEARANFTNLDVVLKRLVQVCVVFLGAVC